MPGKASVTKKADSCEFPSTYWSAGLFEQEAAFFGSLESEESEKKSSFDVLTF